MTRTTQAKWSWRCFQKMGEPHSVIENEIKLLSASIDQPVL